MTQRENGPGNGPLPHHPGTDSSRSASSIEVPELSWNEPHWRFYGWTSSTESCGSPIWGMDLRSGELLSFPSSCDSWVCRFCARRMATEQLQYLAAHLAEVECLWVTTVQLDERLTTRLSQRRLGKGTSYLWVRRLGTLHYLSTLPLLGYKPPTEWIEVSRLEAIELVASEFLALPGVCYKRPSDDWRPPPRKSGSSTAQWFGLVPPEILNPALRVAKKVMRSKYGSDWAEWDHPVEYAAAIEDALRSLGWVLNRG